MVKTNTFDVKEKEMTLRDYFDSLPSFERRPFIKKISDLCDVSEATSYNWVFGRNRPAKASIYRTLSEITGIPQESLFVN